VLPNNVVPVAQVTELARRYGNADCFVRPLQGPPEARRVDDEFPDEDEALDEGRDDEEEDGWQ